MLRVVCAAECLEITTVGILHFMNLRQSLHSICFCEPTGQSGGTGLLTVWILGLEEVWMGNINKAYSSRLFKESQTMLMPFSLVFYEGRICF